MISVTDDFFAPPLEYGTMFSVNIIPYSKGGIFMELFNIIVGIATIISAICSIASLSILNSIKTQIKNIGDNNVNNILQNHGIKNTNTITNNTR